MVVAAIPTLVSCARFGLLVMAHATHRLCNQQGPMEAQEKLACHTLRAQKAGLERVSCHTLQVLKVVLAMVVYRSNPPGRKAALATVFDRNPEQTVRDHNHPDLGLALFPSVGKGWRFRSLAVVHLSASLDRTDSSPVLPDRAYRIHPCRSL